MEQRIWHKAYAPAVPPSIDYEKIGMIASHLGVVRGVSRNGRAVSGIEVKHDQKTVDSIIKDIKKTVKEANCFKALWKNRDFKRLIAN